MGTQTLAGVSFRAGTCVAALEHATSLRRDDVDLDSVDSRLHVFQQGMQFRYGHPDFATDPLGGLDPLQVFAIDHAQIMGNRMALLERAREPRPQGIIARIESKQLAQRFERPGNALESVPDSL
ncbi:TPA: hypothetical protein UMV35_000063 [Stenotrophomonas maltophilia]|nr:hypothetical protein [Stenotrophomonas maltophilia]